MELIPYLLVNGLAITISAGAWFLGGWARHRGRATVIGILALACALICVKSALYQFPVWEAALFPFVWYIWLQDSWVVFLGVLFLGLAIPQIPEIRNRRALGMLLFMVLVMDGQKTWWMIRPEIHGKEIFPDRDHHLAQSTMHTCAPASCAIALSYVGIQVSERHMAELSFTRENGTTIFNSFRALMLTLEGTPFTAKLQGMSLDDLEKSGQVAVVDFPKMRHAVVLRGVGHGFTVHDPLDIVPQDRTREWVANEYGGLALVIVPRR